MIEADKIFRVNSIVATVTGGCGGGGGGSGMIAAAIPSTLSDYLHS